eukprot:GHVN01105691.1.p1 GENE.GHVN01105691.1~~GHVN01105691.1.p1  ORF type:complete len:123 (-),score=15.69 GHVN01105691.1:1363-1686(-)
MPSPQHRQCLQHGNLKLPCLNICSIRFKVDDLSLTLGPINPDIIILTETHPAPGILDRNIVPRGCVVGARYHRPYLSGPHPWGGVAIIHKLEHPSTHSHYSSHLNKS